MFIENNVLKGTPTLEKTGIFLFDFLTTAGSALLMELSLTLPFLGKLTRNKKIIVK